MTGQLPVVFFDNRNDLDPNFSRILSSLKIPNPIFFITGNDSLSSNDFTNPIKVIHLSKLDGYAEASFDFSSRYRHLSTNRYEFELACFLRFFAFELLLTELEADRGWLLDCDVWPKTDIRYFEETSSDWFSPDYWDNETISPHSSLMTLSFVSEFNRFLLKTFYQVHSDEVEKKFIQIKQDFGGGGVCDMTALGIFLRKYWKKQWSDSNTVSAGACYLSHSSSKVYTDLGISVR